MMEGVEPRLLKSLLRRLPFARELCETISYHVAAYSDARRGLEHMERVLAASSEFWRAYDNRVDDAKGPIFVDLMHGNTDYLWRSLVSAKLLQRNIGAPLVALLGEPGAVAPHNLADNAALAKAFDVAELVEIPSRDVRNDYETAAFAAIVELASPFADGTPLPPP
jgi:hypothetical protein